MLYLAGLAAQVTTWLIVCIALPFILGGFNTAGLRPLGFIPILFLIGLMPLCLGSALWMAPFALRRLRHSAGLSYRLWVCVGASLSVLCYLELQFAGDPLPPLWRYWSPVVLAFFLAFPMSTFYARLFGNLRGKV
jgi:hypothetical protein